MKRPWYLGPLPLLLGLGVLVLAVNHTAQQASTLAQVVVPPASVAYTDPQGTIRQHVILVFSDGSTADITPQVVQIPSIIAMVGKPRATVTALLS